MNAADKDVARIAAAMKNGYKSLRVSKRGGIRIDPAEVRASPEWKAALKKAAKIVEEHNPS